jgi:diadenosine tetraphosphate (Ap4A) HIT family hydrolase
MEKKTNCIFCSLDKNIWIAEGNHWFTVPDKFPVSPGHVLVIPKVHRADYFELTPEEDRELKTMLTRMRAQICENDPLVTGFNIGANCGASAGQTVFHCHIHLIPRRTKDVASPEGGVRGVIPEKQKY